MTYKKYVFIAGLGSFLMLMGAFGFQHLGELAPCKLCIWQRWPHAIALGIAIIALIIPYRLIALFGAIAAAATCGIGLYHVGVEQKWWEGPNTCTSGSIDGLSSGELLDQILAAPVVRCDDIPWAFLGISMAGWNAILSAIFVLFWIKALFQRI